MTDERKAYYWLSICGLTAKKQNELLEIYKSPLALFNNLHDKNLDKYAGKCYDIMKRFADEQMLTDRLVGLTRRNIKLLVRSMPGYPVQLNQSEVSPPLALYYRGNADLLSRKCIAVVGSRRSDEYGRDATKHIVSRLVPMLVIVTGHASGIDNYAARYALDNGGSVIIVAACGLDMLRLPDFISRADDSRKLILSEHEPDVAATDFSFPVRNRLISGLSNGVVVVEAEEKSGSLITADCALEQGRTVYAVPGSILSSKSKGTNSLIYKGATALTDASTIFDDLGLQYTGAELINDLKLDGDEKIVYDFLTGGKKHTDEIIQHLGKPPHEVFALLSSMELSGIIKKKISNYYEI